jgi:dihydroneopterin aldolase
VNPAINDLDRICLSGMRAYGYHGVLPFEREHGQVFVVDAVIWLDTSAAARTDDLGSTVDYGSLASRLSEIVAGEPVALLETLAHRLAAACFADNVVQHAEITVHKPQAPVAVPVRDVSVTIKRSRQAEGA